MSAMLRRLLMVVLVVLAGSAMAACERPGAAAPLPLADNDAAACQAAGGKCVPLGDCARGKGSLADGATCGPPRLACCVQGCGEESFSCCDGSATYRPKCSKGKLVCPPSQKRCDPPPPR
jgi:hypothetical protein